MPWIESHQMVGHHPKTIRLAELLRVSLPTAVGHVHYLWWWALDFAPTGAIRTSPTVLARACEWRGSAEKFVQALVAAGFLDERDDGVIVHDWMDYAGRYVDKRAANKERMRTARANHVQRTSGARAGATGPDHTGPNRTVPDTTPLPPFEPVEGGWPFPGPNKTKDDDEVTPACCPDFARTGTEHWAYCHNAPVETPA